MQPTMKSGRWLASNTLAEPGNVLGAETIRNKFAPRDSRSDNKQRGSRKKRSESEKKRYNEHQQRLNGCYWCGEKFPHSAGSKCLGLTSTCKYCKAKGHLEKACLVKKRAESKDKNSSAKYLEESSDDYSRRLGKSADECPRAKTTADGEEADHVLWFSCSKRRQRPK